jgi:hypothetical protein
MPPEAAQSAPKLRNRHCTITGVRASRWPHRQTSSRSGRRAHIALDRACFKGQPAVAPDLARALSFEAVPLPALWFFAQGTTSPADPIRGVSSCAPRQIMSHATYRMIASPR